MPVHEQVRIVLATFPDREIAHSVGRKLVENRLAACVNLIGDVESVYRWKGNVESASECLAIIKTTVEQLPELAIQVEAMHPYEVPEFVALPLVSGLPGYLGWVIESCGESPEDTS